MLNKDFTYHAVNGQLLLSLEIHILVGEKRDKRVERNPRLSRKRRREIITSEKTLLRLERMPL